MAWLVWLLSHLGEPANPQREAARAVLEVRCGKCHRSDSPDAAPRALAVFTLNDVDFAARMNDLQLRDMLGRFTGEISNNEDVTPAELKSIRAFVDEQRKRLRQTAAP